jgi:NAD-dependent deacetylase
LTSRRPALFSRESVDILPKGAKLSSGKTACLFLSFGGDSVDLQQIIDESSRIVFFGGAGVSTESGIPDFRSVDGLYHQQWKYPPEEILSHSFFERNPEEYYRFHREKLVVDGVKPNRAHLKLAELEQAGKLRAVITQNIDGLHQEAGSRNVLELHGSILRAYCSRCRKPYPQEVINHGTGVPRCSCGGVIRPDIVLYEEPLDQTVMEDAVRYIRNAEILIIGGTSLNVYPAAGLIRYYRGNKLVLVNLSETPYDSYANLVIHEKIGEVFSRIAV